MLAPKTFLPPYIYTEKTYYAREQVYEYKQWMTKMAEAFIDFYGEEIEDLKMRVEIAYEFEKSLGLVRNSTLNFLTFSSNECLFSISTMKIDLQCQTLVQINTWNLKL